MAVRGVKHLRVFSMWFECVSVCVCKLCACVLVMCVYVCVRWSVQKTRKCDHSCTRISLPLMVFATDSPAANKSNCH